MEDNLSEKNFVKRAKELLEKYERHISSAFLVIGFVFDFLTIWRIDLWIEELIFIIYLVGGALAIVYLSVYEAEKIYGLWAERLHTFCLYALQFVFGGLFGRFFIFYSRSGSVFTSWPFLVFLLILLLGNEVLRKKYVVFAYRMAIYFVALYSFLIFYLPIVAAEISPRIFVLSGFASVVLMITFAYGLGRLLGGRIRSGLALLAWLIGFIYVSINVMYFTNIIPPIPLSMETGGAYHKLERSGENYLGLWERRAWYSFLQTYPVVHRQPGEAMYVFASVFAPTRITTTVVHVWQYYDEATKEWQITNRLPLSIVGGRDGGYRSYTYKSNPTNGKWRVDIETERGQVIGRIRFRIADGQPSALVQKIL